MHNLEKWQNILKKFCGVAVSQFSALCMKGLINYW